MLEASGDPAAPVQIALAASRGRRKSHEVPGRLPRRGDLLRAPRRPLDRRQHLQGPRRQRPGRPRGRLRRHRPRQERLPARRRDRAARASSRPSAAAATARASPTCSSPGRRSSSRSSRTRSKTKGARLSMELTIAGRYMVYAPTGEGVGVSRRLEDKERDRLRKEAKQLDLGGGGAIIRTAAHGATRADFERELQYLFKLNEVLQKRVADTPAPALVFQEADLSVRVVRDIFSEHFERAIVDDEGAAPPARVLLLAHRAGAGRPRRALRRRRGPAVRGLRRRPGDQRDARAPGGPARPAAT